MYILVKSVIQNMLVHSISIYDWPVSLIKDLEASIRNFIWSGNITKKKLVTVAWKKLCKPTEQGGLGIRSLKKLNQAANLKLCWDLLHKKEDWSELILSRVMRNRKVISHHISSSIWSSIKAAYNVILDHATWLLGNGGNIHFWSDNWCGPPFNLFMNDDEVVDDSILVRDYIIDHRWNLPTDFVFQFPHIWNLVQQVTIPEEDIEDELVWLESSNGKLSFKDAYIFIDTPSQCLQWARCVWSPNIPPSKSLLVWRVMNDKVPVDEKLR